MYNRVLRHLLFGLFQFLVMISCYNTQFAERQLEKYLRDPASVSVSWRKWLDALVAADAPRGHVPGPSAFRPSPERRSIFNPAGANGTVGGGALDSARLQDRVDQLIRAYRVRGHLAAKLDPLGLSRPEPPELALEAYGLSEADFSRRCSTLATGGPPTQTLRELVTRLRDTYCRYIGVQFMHIDDAAVREWLQGRMEGTGNRSELSHDVQHRILTRLTDAVIFEEFVRKKYVGAKTFSLEGAESLIPLLDLAIEKAGRQGIDEIVFAMAHRGRLNVLANIIGKTPQEIFWEFEDPRPELNMGRGDVKYHLGFSGDWVTLDGQKVHLSLCFNPSHLEYVDPVAVGRIRAKQDRSGDTERRRGMALLIHGDAAFAGEGVVQETLNLSQLDGFATGGTLHVVVNNQLGFTTDPKEGRSTTYPTDIARLLQIPIFHVNGEDPEAVAQVIELAMDFRAEFRRDVVVDMFCYRRWGHNEGDEPSFTQPLMYQAIEDREPVRDAYLERLLQLGGVTRDETERIAEERFEELRRAFEEVQKKQFEPQSQTLSGVWQAYTGGEDPGRDAATEHDPPTGVDAKRLSELLRKLAEVPAEFHLHRKLRRGVEHRRKMADGESPLDWAAAEALAIASLAVEGHPVRLCGQDSARGTFSQRHAVLYDTVDGSRHPVFQELAPGQATVQVINSPLSEAGVLGFEYGYSLDYPEALVMWEAQYGDFVNAAQVIIDQFLASAEDKWRRLSGLVLLLPHGFEGMGPEHSSARLERFLNLAAEDNMQITCPTTPVQYFHLLRRQVKRRWRKPLVVLTPKSLLRHPGVVSAMDEFAADGFRRILPDERVDAKATRRVLLCSGKVYYDLAEFRRENDRDDVAIVRIEQLYPLSEAALRQSLGVYADDTPVVWVQEEPENMGACTYWKARFGGTMVDHPFHPVARPESASPATGSKGSHKREQRELVGRAFDDEVVGGKAKSNRL